MFEIKEVSKDCFEGIYLEDDFECKGQSYDEVLEVMENHEREIKELENKEKEWLLKGNVRNRFIQLNENIDSLIDVAHETYMVTSETDVENRARLDAQIQAYWNVKSMVEDILKIK